MIPKVVVCVGRTGREVRGNTVKLAGKSYAAA